MKNKLAIIGASYLQLPLIEKAKELGCETHVFAWAAGDVGETAADFFYPISIVEKESILQKCREIGIDGICSIASDLAAITVNYVAYEMGLVGNSPYCAQVSTNKHLMRECFMQNSDPSPLSIMVKDASELKAVELSYPIIVKPVDRSGSRGITKLDNAEGLEAAIENAKEQGFEKCALVEEFAKGQEYSVECISVNGNHHFLAMTHKFTTGAPGFIETGHLEPAPVDADVLERVKNVVYHALDSLKIENGASHSELKIDENGNIRLIEIGGRMGGDCIGSDLVHMSTGIDFVKAVIQVALGRASELVFDAKPSGTAAIRFIFTMEDIAVLEKLKAEHPEYLVREDVQKIPDGAVTDSSSRFGYFLMKADNNEQLKAYLPW